MLSGTDANSLGAPPPFLPLFLLFPLSDTDRELGAQIPAPRTLLLAEGPGVAQTGRLL